MSAKKILVVLLFFFIFAIFLYNNLKISPKGGEGTGMFEYPKVTELTLSNKEGTVSSIKDTQTIQKIQQLCKQDNAFVELKETQENIHCDTWLDFNNSWAVIGVCSSEPTYGNLKTEKSEQVNMVINKDLYDYILELTQ